MVFNLQEQAMKHKYAGYTLIELMIALSLMAILMAYGLPNYYSFKQNQIMRQEVNRLVGSINFARNHSINASEYVVLCATQSMTSCDGATDWHGGWMVFLDNNETREFDDGDQLLMFEHGINHNISATSSQYRQKIRFDQMGAAPGTNLTVRFCDDRGADFGKAVIISNVGRPRVTQSIDSCG